MLAKTAKEASELSGRPVDWFKMDVTKKDEIAQTVKAIIDKHGRIDVLVNNAGVSTMNPVVDMTEEEWDFCMNVNAKDPFLVTKAGVAGFEPTTLCLGVTEGISRTWGRGKSPFQYLDFVSFSPLNAY